MPFSFSDYELALRDARKEEGRITVETVKRIQQALAKQSYALTQRLASLPRGVDAASRQRAIEASRKIVQQTYDELERVLQQEIAGGRTQSFETIQGVWQKASAAVAEQADIPSALLGAVQAPPVTMMGAFETLGGGVYWKTLVHGHVKDAAGDAAAIVQAALLDGVSPDTLAKQLRPYVQGSEEFRKLLGMPGAGEQLQNLANTPASLRGAARRLSFNSDRIAFSELHNARAEAETQHFIVDPMVDYVHWETAARRGNVIVPDVCDGYAHSDLYGLGAGNYPVDSVPAPPHPFDRCERVPHVRAAKDFGKPKPGGTLDVSRLHFGPHMKNLTGAQHDRLLERSASLLSGRPIAAARVREMMAAAKDAMLKQSAEDLTKVATESEQQIISMLKKAIDDVRPMDDVLGELKHTIEKGTVITYDNHQDEFEALRAARKKVVKQLTQDATGMTAREAELTWDHYMKLTSGWIRTSDGPSAGIFKSILADLEDGLHVTYHDGYIDHQEAAAQAFRDSVERYLGQFDWTSATLRGIRAMAKADRDLTQATIRELYGGDTITVYRGVSSEYFTHQNIPSPKRGDVLNVSGNVVSSWSTSRMVAADFGEYILEMKVPISDVFGHHMYFLQPRQGQHFENELEVLVFGRPHTATIVKAPSGS